MRVRAGYLVDGVEQIDEAEGPNYEAAKAQLPEREEQRIWITVDR
jgi:hypothetical protein